MTAPCRKTSSEPVISVGLIQDTASLSFRLESDFTDSSGRRVPAGEYEIECRGGVLRCACLDCAPSVESTEMVFKPMDVETSRFSLEATIGIDFHWQRNERQSFCGSLRFTTPRTGRFSVINDVPLETYIVSVICSEMGASTPPELVKAHGVVSRSWLTAQLDASSFHGGGKRTLPIPDGEIIRWYDREAHTAFDVCADDHCQRYQGVGRIESPDVPKIVRDTRGEFLTFDGRICDARFSKSCGGVTEDFRVAWGDEKIPYLVPVFDGPFDKVLTPTLADENIMRDYIQNPPDVYCWCTDRRILDEIMTSYDRRTVDFFRWRTELSAHRVGELLAEKLGVHRGRIVSLEPVERGHSGRLKRLRFVGERGSVVVGKELEIRRVLSSTHLYSSAFIVDVEGPAHEPDAFILSGAGWGHGVGLCQIGAAVMAWRGIGYKDILEHYYPGTQIERLYE